MIDILIVEDDTELSALLTDFLRNEGIYCFSSGRRRICHCAFLKNTVQGL